MYNIGMTATIARIFWIALLGVIVTTTQSALAFTQAAPLKGTMMDCSCCCVPSGEAVSSCSSQETKETSMPCASKNEGQCCSCLACCKAHAGNYVLPAIDFAALLIPDGERFQSIHFIGLVRGEAPELPPPRGFFA